MDPEQLQRAQRTGRRFGIGIFALIVSTFVIVCSAQILYQGFHDSEVVLNGNCRALVAHLASSVRAAREAARNVTDERMALRTFRNALEPNWHSKSQLNQICQSDRWAREAVATIDEWRWAEEIAIRYEAVDLAPTRRKAQAIISSLGPESH